ncbi:hypothetical protein GSI_15378 [Ganoderma sinense ZZ0214-1]|uniref:Uncharacterized protein n=1 Tax=Ganoderma sinense ZZ0214-1 TaxID=1077348 RepID=A0A2G8RME3_9APHY|nr:hypothetical protein GSI_15378 [Ganoderma sinense ZZ0214-1]
MYLSDIANEAYYSHSPHRLARTRDRDRDLDATTILSTSQSGIGGPARRTSHLRRMRSAISAAPTSIPLDDNFDAYTTEVPTEWHPGDHDHDHGDDQDRDRDRERDGHPEYDESVSGYRNYVTEMERMLSGQMESAARAQERQYQHFQAQLLEQQQQQQLEQSSPTPGRLGMRRSTTSGSISEGPRGTGLPRLGGGSGGRREREAPVPVPPPENAREVSGKKGKIELVEQHVLEDSPARTISLWRERVAASSAGGTSDGGEEIRSDAGDSHAPARLRGLRQQPPSSSTNSDARLRRAASERPRYMESIEGSGTKSGRVRGTPGGKHARASYERSEYIVSYQNPRKDGMPKELFSPISQGREITTPSSPTLSRMQSPPSPTLRRHAHRKSLERSEYMMAYPQTPPLTASQASSSSPAPAKGNPNQLNGQPHEESTPRRVSSTSSVEIILSSCDPSLLHIAPILYDLGIKRVDHLRAIARLSDDTRDREVKEEALKRGVTVVEWAIFLDKLQSL